ncbi:MAG: VapE domain-containing protein [Lachnospiraceae bacterium]
MNNLDYPSMYHAAMEYIKMGLAVFPLEERGKKPKTRNGCNDATTDAAQVKAWWQQSPNANIGIATGRRSGGITVIDLDIDEDKGIDGYHTLEDWQRENGTFPETWTAITGRGGYHLYFKDKTERRNRAGIIDGVDVRGDGGYVVAPPSIHSNGNRYEWEYAPEDIELAKASDTVKFFLETGTSKFGSSFTMPEKINAGERNQALFKYACMMRAKGSSDAAIYAAVLAENIERCMPPVEEKEVKTIVAGVIKRYESGKPIHFNEHGEASQGWREPKLSMTANGKVYQIVLNAVEAIEYDEKLYGKIKYNTISYSPFIVGELPWEHINKYREWKNSDDSNLKSYIESRYGIRSMERIMEGLSVVMDRNPYNPVGVMLEDCYVKWDKKTGYIENLLPDYLGVEKTEYTSECMKLFMLGAIHRAFSPGSKFDYMPVFVGKQGVGKSTFLRLLSMNNAWYNDNFNTVEGDKAPEKLRGMWMVEMAELLATKKAKEVESIKAFLTSTVDTYRPPYGRRTEQRPRVCVFAGTTNNEQFLTDRTGNRRFLPIICRKDYVRKSMFKDKAAVVANFRSAWGEAMQLYIDAKREPELILPKHLSDFVESTQNQYMEEDVRVGIIQEWLDTSDMSRVCVAMLFEKALGNANEKPSKYESTELHSIMTNSITGWTKLTNSNGGRARCGGYGVQICYERSRADDAQFMELSDNNTIPFE